MSKLSRRIARSQLAPVAAFPVRARAVASYDARVIGASARWLVASREHTNYTYELTARNRDHLAWWVSEVSGCEVRTVRGFIAELDEDESLRAHVLRETAGSARRRLADDEVRYGRRAGWYALVRATRPDRIVETGTDKGLGSCVLAAALLRNGHGRLTTMDVNPDSGYLVTGRYGEVVDRVVGDSVAALKAGGGQVDLFLHDSLHTFDHETAELQAVESRLSARALVLSDNAHESDALARWAESTGRHFLYFREVPQRHWVPGEGIGAAWSPARP